MIGVAILGSGFMARTHAAAWAEHADRAEVRVVASRTIEGAAKVAEICGAEASDDLLAALARDDIQVVDICLPTPLHRPIAEAIEIAQQRRRQGQGGKVAGGQTSMLRA